jgi:hypothetical protein
VITTGVSGGGSGGFARFDVYQTPDNSVHNCFLIFTEDNTHFTLGICLDVSLDILPVAVGDHFTKEAVLRTPGAEFLGLGDLDSASSFYLGIYTPTRFSGFETNLPIGIGWVRISYLNGTFAVLDSAIDFSGQGLIVGTTTVIPEGATPACVALFLLGLGTSRRRDV